MIVLSQENRDAIVSPRTVTDLCGSLKKINGGQGKTSKVDGSASANGPSLSASASVATPGNGVNAGNSSYTASADAEWNDTLTVSAGGVPASGHLGIILSSALTPSLMLTSNFPTISQATANLSYGISLFVADPSSLAPGTDPGGGAVSCNDSVVFGAGGIVQASSTSCLPLDSFVLNGLAYSLHMSLDAGVVSEPFDNTVSASDPFTFSLAPTQSGVQVLSASGFSYLSQPTPPPTPAPEPSSLVLLASGLACLLPRGSKMLNRP